MALIIKDRVKETTTTTGTGNVALGGAVSNFVTFSSVLSDSDTTYYAIVDSNNSDFEVGWEHMSAAVTQSPEPRCCKLKQRLCCQLVIRKQGYLLRFPSRQGGG